jgi:hypothetical protein
MTKRTTKWMPFWRHNPSQNAPVEYLLGEELMAAVGALTRISG